MAIIVRVTDKRGRGVYHSAIMRRTGLCGISRPHRPMPVDDGLEIHGQSLEHLRFGFKDANDLKKWFAEDIPRLADHTQVRMYEVAERYVNYGSRQLTFDRRKAKLLAIKTIVDI